MKPEALQRALIRAIAFGDTENEHHLRQHLGFHRLAHTSAVDYLHATALVCLAHRFGEPAPSSPTETDHVNRDRTILNHAALDRTAFGHVVIDHTVLDHAILDRAVLNDEALDRPVIDDNELGRFMAELRSTGPELRPPQNFLEVEAVIRGLYGEPHMLEEIGAKQQREALTFLLRYLTDSTPEIREDFEAIIDQAQALQRRWLIG